MTTTDNTGVDNGILSDLGLGDVPDGLAVGTYKGNVYGCKVQTLKDVSKGKSLVFTYKVNDPESSYNGETIDEWKSINKFDTNVKKRFLKERLVSLGIPETRFDQFRPDDVIGLDVFFTVKKNGQYTNITDVTLIEGDASSVSAPSQAASSNLEDLL